MGWCLYEAGQFRRKLLAEGSEELIQSRFVAIHDDERPSQLAKFQSVQISGKDLYGHTLDLKTERPEEEATRLHGERLRLAAEMKTGTTLFGCAR
jgi:hypothetical protein